MELRQLEYFVTVTEEANFTRAAEKLHVAQPGVSAQIRQLERELGQELLDRSGRTVRLTEVGAAVLPYARAALAAVSGVRDVVDELTGLMRGHVAVGMVGSPGILNVPGVLAGFHDAHPGVTITLSEGNTDKLVEGLRGGRLDAAYVGLSAVDPPGISTLALWEEPIVAAVLRDDDLATNKSVTLDALKDRPLITLCRGSGIRACVDDASAVAGLDLEIAFEASEPDVLMRLAKRGFGVAILPRSAIEAHQSDLVSIEITPTMTGRRVLAWRTDGPPSPAARAFLVHARSAAG
jgi:DNA-binding transcriptional LysR family regulator